MDTQRSKNGESRLARGLTARHMRFIGLGSAIGVGLFLGSGAAISRAGPALLIVYAISGAAIFLMARALGELMLNEPVEGGFATYARTLIGPRTAFMVGWTYWLILILGCAAELTAVGIFLRSWFPQLPQWASAFTGAVLLCGTNLLAVKIYGVLEYWFAVIKVAMILVMIACGLGVLWFGWGESSQSVGIANLWRFGGFMPNGWHGVFEALPYSLAAFGGVELIAMTAAEARDPEASVPRAVNGLIFRIIVFYLGTIAIILMLYPWSSLDPARSPFVMVLERVGLPAAAGIMNVVVITALLSSCNSNIFGSSRMLHALSVAHEAPGTLRVLNSRAIPARCVIATAAVLLIIVALNYVIPEQAFAYLMGAISSLYLSVWAVIILCHLAYARRCAANGVTRRSFRLPGYPISNWLSLFTIAAAAIVLGVNESTRPVYIAVVAWLVLLAIIRECLERTRRAATTAT